MSRMIRGLGRWGLVVGLSASLVGVVSAGGPQGPVVLAFQKTSAKKKGVPAKKGTAKKGEDGMAAEEGAMPAAGKAATPAPGAVPAGGPLSFKRDIAPIFVANCVGCHSGNGRGLTRSRFDMTTFEKIMAGGKRGKDDVVPGEPDSSHLVLMIKGEEKPKMPQTNGLVGFSEDAVAKIEAWVKAGARLDAGVSPTDPLNKYAATEGDLRKAELEKMAPEQRDKLAEQAGRDRWKKASKVEPELTSGAHFLLLGNLPKARAEKLLKTMETQYATTNRLLSTGRTPVLNPAEKIGLYIFKDTNTFVEFVRANENQEIEAGETARARLNVESPYLVAADPANGGEEAAPATKKGARKSKKGDDSAAGSEQRALAALLTEQLVAAAANQAGKPPKWVSLGLGAYVASGIEPGNPYYRRLRAETAENIRIGWINKANEALGGEGKLESTRAVGFSLFEWMAANDPTKKAIGDFVQAMLGGQGKLDDAIVNCLGIESRETFLNMTGGWLGERYGRL